VYGPPRQHSRRVVEKQHVVLDRPLARIGPRQREQLSDDRTQAASLPLDRLEGGGIAGRVARLAAATSARVRSSVMGVRSSWAASAMNRRICSIDRSMGAVDCRVST